MSGEFLRIIAALQQQMNATFSRSDVLRPLHILFGMLVIVVISLVYVKAPDWLVAWAAYGMFGVAFIEVFSYIYCLFVDRDSLRSEKYQLQKMAMQAHVVGDEGTGIFEDDDKLILRPTSQIEMKLPGSLPVSVDPEKPQLASKTRRRTKPQ